ncbi:MAG: pilus assembly protein PilP [Bdellovibrionales bacterium]|nr:pilus assembly protein PilP [Bdellovibrionales bacterium]
MAKKSNSKGASKLIKILGGLAVLLSAVFLFLYLNQKEQKTIKQIIDESLDAKADLDPHRKAQLRVQLAVTDYMDKNNGNPPQGLSELVPVYFDTVPIDPTTNEPFEYHVSGTMWSVGGKSAEKKTPSKAEASGTSKSEMTALISSLDTKEEAYVYDPLGKRDPFQPFNMKPKENLEGKTPLERFSIGQLRLTAVLEGMGNPTALVETSTGKGYNVTIGTKIGVNNGEVIEIHPSKILILETTIDFTGKKQTRTVEMRLRTGNKQK